MNITSPFNPSSKDLRSVLAEALLTPSRRQDLRVVLQRALNTWEAPPPWLVELSDCLDSFVEQPHEEMSQYQARIKVLAKLRIPTRTFSGELLHAGTEVVIAWNRSYRIYPEGAQDSGLIHEFQILGQGEASSTALALAPHAFLYDFKPAAV